MAATVSSSWKHFLLVLQHDSGTHPPEYPFACQGVICRKISADKKGVPYSAHATHNLYQWCMHREGECKVLKKKLHTQVHVSN